MSLTRPHNSITQGQEKKAADFFSGQVMTAGNPIFKHKFTADPFGLVYNDVLYIYTGHDEAPVGTENYQMNDWLCFSTTNLKDWTEYPVPLAAKDFLWSGGDAYASEVISRDGKFYWFAAVTHATIPGKAIGVAVSDKPEGPYKDAIGKALITNDMTTATSINKDDIDPTVLIDDDGQAYLFWGNTVCYYVKLKASMIETDGDIRTVDLPEFSEGAFIYKRDGWYFLLYGYQMPEKVAYARSRSVDGPWEFMGVIVDTVENCETNSPAIVDYKGKSYFVYHNGALTDGSSHRRSVCIDNIFFKEDGTISKIYQTKEGVAVL